MSLKLSLDDVELASGDSPLSPVAFTLPAVDPSVGSGGGGMEVSLSRRVLFLLMILSAVVMLG
jgi:hypothetical protein